MAVELRGVVDSERSTTLTHLELGVVLALCGFIPLQSQDLLRVNHLFQTRGNVYRWTRGIIRPTIDHLLQYATLSSLALSLSSSSWTDCASSILCCPSKTRSRFSVSNRCTSWKGMAHKRPAQTRTMTSP